MTGTAWAHQREVLGPDKLERRVLRPAILLITAGLPTDQPGGFVDRLVAASMVVSRMSEERADREALAQTLWHPPAGPALGPLDDSIR